MLCSMCQHGTDKWWECKCGESHCRHIRKCPQCDMKLGKFIETDGSATEIQWKDFEDIRKLIDGYVEIAYGKCLLHDEPVAILCDEDGLAKRLPLNVAVLGFTGKDIVGDVVIVDPKDLD